MARLSSEETREQMLDRNTNPIIAAGSIVSINLACERAIAPEEIYDALTTQFGSAKIHADTDVVAFNGGYNLRVVE